MGTWPKTRLEPNSWKWGRVAWFGTVWLVPESPIPSPSRFPEPFQRLGAVLLLYKSRQNQVHPYKRRYSWPRWRSNRSFVGLYDGICTSHTCRYKCNSATQFLNASHKLATMSTRKHRSDELLESLNFILKGTEYYSSHKQHVSASDDWSSIENSIIAHWNDGGVCVSHAVWRW